MSDGMWSLIQSCWSQQRSNRPSSQLVAEATAAVQQGVSADDIAVMLRVPSTQPEAGSSTGITNSEESPSISNVISEVLSRATNVDLQYVSSFTPGTLVQEPEPIVLASPQDYSAVPIPVPHPSDPPPPSTPPPQDPPPPPSRSDKRQELSDTLFRLIDQSTDAFKGGDQDTETKVNQFKAEVKSDKALWGSVKKSLLKASTDEASRWLMKQLRL